MLWWLIQENFRLYLASYIDVGHSIVYMRSVYETVDASFEATEAATGGVL